MKTVCLLLVILCYSKQSQAYSKYGRTCKDIGCATNEQCVMAETPCSYSSRENECGMYPTCTKTSGAARTCATYICPPTNKCIQDGDTPKCIDDNQANTPGNQNGNKGYATYDTHHTNDQSSALNPNPVYPALPGRATTSPINQGGYQGGSVGSGYPGGSVGSGYPGGSAGSGYPGGSVGSRYPSGSVGSGYPGGSVGSGYPGGSVGSGYPGGSVGSGYPGGSVGSGYPGGSVGSGYPGGNVGSGYPGGNVGSGYPGGNVGSGYPGQGGSYPAQRYPQQPNPQQGYPQHGYPQQGYPQQGHGNQRYPPQGGYQQNANRYGQQPTNTGSNSFYDSLKSNLATYGTSLLKSALGKIKL